MRALLAMVLVIVAGATPAAAQGPRLRLAVQPISFEPVLDVREPVELRSSAAPSVPASRTFPAKYDTTVDLARVFDLGASLVLAVGAVTGPWSQRLERSWHPSDFSPVEEEDRKMRVGITFRKRF